MKRGFIFDFDGVIVDSEKHWDELSYETYVKMIPAFTKEYDKQLKGRNMHDIYTMLVRDFGLDISKEEYVNALSALTDKIYGELCGILPGVKDLLSFLVGKGIPTAIASSSERPWIESTLKRLGMEGMFGPLITAADVGAGKPNPAVFLEAARIIGVEPEYCMVLEDSENGVRAAKNAKMTCIGLHHKEGYVQDLSDADIEIQTIDEITEDMLARFGF